MVAKGVVGLIGGLLTGIILVLLMVFGGPLAAGFLAKYVSEDAAIWGAAVPVVAVLIMLGAMFRGK